MMDFQNSQNFQTRGNYQKAKFWRILEKSESEEATNKTMNKVIECDLCPHRCHISEGRTGICGVRKNIDGELYSINYGEITSIALDPIEKKPLFHFHPGSSIISIGSWGCNLKCQFCQNWQISQSRPMYIKKLEPVELVRIANEYRAEGNIGIAYTYNEPIVSYEFVYDTAKIAHSVGLKNVLVTNGYINAEPLEEIGNYIDAMNIDLKALDNEFYKKFCGGRYEPILNTIEFCVKHNIHVEVTTLVVTGGNDELENLEQEFKILSEISKDIPLHLSRYHPAHKHTKPSTSIELLIEAYKRATKYLNYVYLGNVWAEKYESTYCPKCGNAVIIRKGYNIKIENLDNEGRCKVCNNQILKNL